MLGSMFNKILVPLDGSIFAEQALPSALELARGSGGSLILMRVSGHPNTRIYVEGTAVFSLPSDDSAAHCEAYLERMAGPIREQGIAVKTRVVDGMVADEILSEAATLGVEVIVMTSHGRSGFGRWLMGSVADRIMQYASVPVMIVRPVHHP